MRFHHAPRPLLQLVAALLLAPCPTLAAPNHPPSEQGGLSFNQLFARDCSGGTTCGYYGQLCCAAGSACYTDAQSRAQCTPNGATATEAASGGYYSYYTTTIVQTDLVTTTQVMSTYIGGAAVATATASCNTASNETPCGSICCASGQYCYSSGTCKPAAGGGSSGYVSGTSGSGATAVAPVRPTTSGTVVIMQTITPTTTVPFMTPVATGSNVTLTSSQADNGGGLSGGAIAGIVIGVLAGLLLLALLCFYCCIKGLLDGCLACFGLGGRRRRRTEVEEYERHSHHTSRHGGGGGRTWYGASRPATRVDRTDRRESRGGSNLLGIGAGLAALWAILGLKRKRDNRRDEKFNSEYSYSSDYYTSASSASSDDRRTRHTGRYSRR
ncbi:cell wall integrity and stress response component 1-like [Lecanosticta acicola]|uniref:Cell wall integrity and stress response component 1-like n=1 Tax=Lecanosticta acicola TaxID=111012 RepID=A0AAI8Z040_9PEZI|nr:cell wall integrity and stress response component 1-like [Lecanosticta acicola]